MNLDEFKALCKLDPEFRRHMRVAFRIMERDKEILAALADGAVPTAEGKAKAAAMREILMSTERKNKMLEVAAGLMILANYEGQITAEHDVIYAGPAGFGAVSDEDREKLFSLNWLFSDSEGCWYIFV